MIIAEVNDAKAVEMKDPLFIGGKVLLQRLVGEPGHTEQVGVAMVNFSTGARTKLHTHTQEQILYVTRGKGIVATDKEEHVVTPGTLIFIPGGERHWHGAGKDGPFSHLSIARGKMEIVE
jgi:quercetin dioxygenase-like cupin family protein